jgi:hypothetical protein
VGMWLFGVIMGLTAGRLGTSQETGRVVASLRKFMHRNEECYHQWLGHIVTIMTSLSEHVRS